MKNNNGDDNGILSIITSLICIIILDIPIHNELLYYTRTVICCLIILCIFASLVYAIKEETKKKG